MKTRIILLCLGLLLVSCGDEDDATTDSLSPNSNLEGAFNGTYEDIPVADNDLYALQQLLNDKWTYFLIEMDKYNQVRDSGTNDEMVKKMEWTWADEFEFNAYNPDGSQWGNTQGTYTPRSWLEAQDVDSWNLLHPESTLLVPNYYHVITVLEPGKRVLLEGYHEHLFVGAELRLLVGDSRQMAFDEIIYEKRDDGTWRIVKYQETVWGASEMAPPPWLPVP